MSVRAVLYLRQSLARKGESEDTSLSLDSQETACRAHCDRLGYVVVDVIRDHDVKGSDPNRPGMRELMARAKRGEVDCVVVFAMSRFARDSVYQEMTWRELRKYKTTVESLNEPNISHTLIRQMMGAVNQYRSEEIGAHISAAVKERSHRGKSWGRVPLGYTRIPPSKDAVPADDPKPGTLVIDPAGAEIVRQIFDRWLSGHALRRIAAHLIAAGVPAYSATAWSPKTVAWILRNPVYVGDVRLSGRVVAQDAHDAIVSRETWEAAQRRFTAPRVRDKPRVRSWVEGQVIHACGARMHLTLVPRSRPGGAYPDGYPSFRCGTFNVLGRRCTEPRQHVGQPLLEEAVRQCLIADLSDVLDPAAAIRRQRQRAGSDVARSERAKLTRELAGIANQRREAESLVLTRRRDVAWLDAKDAEFRATEAAIGARLAALPAVPDEGDLAVRWRDVRAFRQGIALADGNALGRILAAVGIAVVGEDGVMIAYGPGFSELVASPVTMPIRRVRG